MSKDKDLLGAQSATEDVSAGSIDRVAASHAAPTPGPWKRQPGSDLNPSVGIFTEGGPFVAQTVGGNDEANAHLIAAAPEMKTACEDALSLLRFIRDKEPDAWDRVLTMRSVSGWTALNTWDSLKAAIAKAEGRR